MTVPDFSRLSTEELIRLADEVAEADARDWSKTARPEQLAPATYKQWIVQAGRGFGKTRCAAEEVAKIADANPGCTIAVIAQRDQKLDTICFNGQDGSSLCEVIPKSKQVRYYSTSGDIHLKLTNGSIIRGFSSEKPDGIAGYNLAAWWADEFALFSPKNAGAVLWQLKMAARKKGVAPRGIITTTPRRVQHMRDILKKAEADPQIVVTRGRTMDNQANLAPEFIEEIHKEFGGTRLGMQELEGELLDDVPGALWSGDLIAAARAACPDPMPEAFDRVIVGFDPSGGGEDATGIVVGGQIGTQVYALADYTINDTPGARFEAGCRAAYDYGASVILYEHYFGADLNLYGLQEAWRNLLARNVVEGEPPKIKATTLRGDKAKRAGPVVALYEQGGRVFHAAGLDQLEDEMTTWDPDDSKAPSPNRIDAWTYVVRYLTDKPRTPVAAAVPRGSRAQVRGGRTVLTQRQIGR